MAIDLTSSTPNGQHTSPSHVASSKSLLNVFLSGSVFWVSRGPRLAFLVLTTSVGFANKRREGTGQTSCSVFLFVPVSHLTMNGITSLNYPQVAFESWSLPVPGRKTLSLTCAGFVLFHWVLPSKWKLLLHYFYCLPCFQKQLEAALFENKHFLFTKRLYSGESIKLKYVGLVAGCILLYHSELSASYSLPQLCLGESGDGWDNGKFMALSS